MAGAARAPEPPPDRARRPGRRHAARHRATAARSSPSTCATSATREVMAEAALVGALEDRPIIFEGLEDVEPAERGRLLRAIETRPSARSWPRPTRTAALALGERTVLLVEAASPSFAERRQAWADLTGTAETGDVAAKFRLSMTQIVEAAEVARLSATARGAERARADRPRRSAPARPPRRRLGELAARLPPGYRWEDLVVPERQRELLQSISAYLRHRDRVLSRLGLREDRRAHPGPEGPVRGRVRHRQDDGRPGDRRRARPGDLPRRPRDHGVASTSVRPRRTSTGSSAPPRARTRSCSSTRPTRCSASAPRSATRTTATRTSRSPTCCRRWRATRARSSSPRTSAATSTTRSSAAWTS